MKTGHRMIRTMVAGLLMGAALVAVAGSVAPAAEAGPRPEARDRTKTKKSEPRQKREVKPRRENDKAPARDRADRKDDARAVRRDNRRDDGRAPQARRDEGRRDAGRRGDARAPQVRRDDRRDGRHDDRWDRGRDDRGILRGVDRWHRRIEHRHDHVVYIPQRWFPRYVRLPLSYVSHRHYRPWYARAARIYINDDPFYFHVGLGVYIGGIALEFDLGNTPPYGYVFYDPYCDEVFWTLAEYRMHMRWIGHPAVLTLIDADYCGY